MKMSKSIDIYEKMLMNAWKTTWHHKGWWFLGALAGLASTGAVFNNVFKIFVRLQPAQNIDIDTLENIFPTLPWLTAYARNLLMLNNWELQAYIVSSIVFGVLLAALILTAQHLLIGAAASGANKSPWEQLKKVFSKIHHLHLWRIFAVDALALIATTILLGLGALCLSLLLGDSLLLNFLSYSGIYALVLPIAFIINVCVMVTLIHIVRHEDTIGVAFAQASHLIKKHWLTALEYALLIFVINFTASVLLIVAMLLVAGLTGLLFELMSLTGSFILMAFVTFLGTLFAAAVFITFAGGLTMFNYAAWVEITDRLKRYEHIPAVEHALQKFSEVFAK